jgi:hypothetical protein
MKGTRRNLRKRKQTRRQRPQRKQRGGDTKAHACKMPYPSGEPEAIRTGAVLSEEEINNLKHIIDEIPTKSFFILKIGSNDSEGVVGNAFNNIRKYGFSSGSKGKKGSHYYEYPATGPIDRNTVLGQFGELPLAKVLLKNTKPFQRDDMNNGFLLAISPIPEYKEYRYPFIGEENFYSIFTNNLAGSKYVQAFFPLTETGRNKEILDLFVSREEPLIIFNAMASSCYVSMKYIIDLRKRAGKLTYYMGLADSYSDKLSCDINHPIYPNRDESCN